MPFAVMWMDLLSKRVKSEREKQVSYIKKEMAIHFSILAWRIPWKRIVEG